MKNYKIVLLTLAIGSISAYIYAKKDKPAQQESSSMGIVTLPSGMRYEITKPSKLPADQAKTPTKGKPVTVHYTGYLDDNGKEGKKFDSSHNPGRDQFKFIIGIGQVIKGWDEGVMGMKVGEHRRLYIPASLGYGARGAGAVIPPNANLIFDVELIGVG